MTSEQLAKAIKIAKLNINLLKIELRGPKPYPGAELQLEYELHVLELLTAEYEGRLHIVEPSEKCLVCREKRTKNSECNNKRCMRNEGYTEKKEALSPKKKLFRLGR